MSGLGWDVRAWVEVNDLEGLFKPGDSVWFCVKYFYKRNHLPSTSSGIPPQSTFWCILCSPFWCQQSYCCYYSFSSKTWISAAFGKTNIYLSYIFSYDIHHHPTLALHGHIYSSPGFLEALCSFWTEIKLKTHLQAALWVSLPKVAVPLSTFNFLGMFSWRKHV